MALTVALDTSAVVRYIDKEAGYERIRELLNLRNKGDAILRICANHWAETVYVLLKQLRASILITADFDVKSAEADVRIEFLPKKPKT